MGRFGSDGKPKCARLCEAAMAAIAVGLGIPFSARERELAAEIAAGIEVVFADQRRSLGQL